MGFPNPSCRNRYKTRERKPQKNNALEIFSLFYSDLFYFGKKRKILKYCLYVGANIDIFFLPCK